MAIAVESISEHGKVTGMIQTTFDFLEQDGSNLVWDMGKHKVSFLEGEWNCTCEYMTRKTNKPPEDKYCRAILKVQVEVLKDRISILEDHIQKLENGLTKKRSIGMGVAHKIGKPSHIHLAILRILAEHRDERPAKWIIEKLREMGIRGTDNTLNGRISECLGQGWLRMTRDHRVVFFRDDFGTFQFRFDEQGGHRKPCYLITELGWAVLRAQL